MPARKARQGKAYHGAPVDLLLDRRTVIIGLVALLLCWRLLHGEVAAPKATPTAPIRVPDELEKARLAEIEAKTKDWFGRVTVTEAENFLTFVSLFFSLFQAGFLINVFL